jgi:hypothetical protein
MHAAKHVFLPNSSSPDAPGNILVTGNMLGILSVFCGDLDGK